MEIYAMYLLKGLVIICILAFSYILAQKILAKISVKRNRGRYYEAFDNYKSIKTHKEFRGIFLDIDRWLQRSGRPFNFNASSYILIKISSTIILSVLVILKGNTAASVIMATVLAFFGIDVCILIISKMKEKAIMKDMPSVISRMYLQLNAGVPLGKCLEILPEAAVYSTDLKNNLKELYFMFVLKQRDIDEVCDHMEKKFGNITVITLLMAFRQYKKTGDMMKILRRQYDFMQKKEEELIELSSNLLLLIAAASLLLISVNCMIVALYPVIIDLIKGLSYIFS